MKGRNLGPWGKKKWMKGKVLASRGGNSGKKNPQTKRKHRNKNNGQFLPHSILTGGTQAQLSWILQTQALQSRKLKFLLETKINNN